jgi:prepilin-type N-terminal cleavage/methylation domain-containing protein
MALSKSKGFTLIELLIVVIIIGILTMLSYPALSRWAVRWQLQAAARDVRSNFQLGKITAVKDNANCVIQFNLPAVNSYTKTPGQGNAEVVNLPVNWGVSFGGPAAIPVPDDPIQGGGGLGTGGSGITFANNQAIFRANGRPDPANVGTVYLRNNQGIAFAVSLYITGNIQVRRWNGAAWELQ